MTQPQAVIPSLRSRVGSERSEGSLADFWGIARVLDLAAEAAQAQRIAYDSHRRKRHRGGREDGRVLSQEWDQR